MNCTAILSLYRLRVINSEQNQYENKYENNTCCGIDADGTCLIPGLP